MLVWFDTTNHQIYHHETRRRCTHVSFTNTLIKINHNISLFNTHFVNYCSSCLFQLPLFYFVFVLLVVCSCILPLLLFHFGHLSAVPLVCQDFIFITLVITHFHLLITLTFYLGADGELDAASGRWSAEEGGGLVHDTDFVACACCPCLHIQLEVRGR